MGGKSWHESNLVTLVAGAGESAVMQRGGDGREKTILGCYDCITAPLFTSMRRSLSLQSLWGVNVDSIKPGDVLNMNSYVFLKQNWRVESSAVEKLVLCTVAVLHSLDRWMKRVTISLLSSFICAEWNTSFSSFPVSGQLSSLIPSLRPSFHSLSISLS